MEEGMQGLAPGSMIGEKCVKKQILGKMFWIGKNIYIVRLILHIYIFMFNILYLSTAEKNSFVISVIYQWPVICEEIF